MAAWRAMRACHQAACRRRASADQAGAGLAGDLPLLPGLVPSSAFNAVRRGSSVACAFSHSTSISALLAMDCQA